MSFVKSLSCGKEERENPQIKLHGLVCGFIEDFTWSPLSESFFKRKMGIFPYAENLFAKEQ